VKEAILQLLKNGQGSYVSGGEICKSLKVTRTAIWKHVQTLRDEGYVIEARPRLGYLLSQMPDRLYPQEVADGIKSNFVGRQVYYYDVIETSNDTAKELAGEKAPNGAVVIAEEQGGGKGRLGRSWYSPKYTGIYFSIILHPTVSPSEASQLTMVAAVAYAQAVRRVTGVQAGIKWPNDLLVNGRKICGILTEMSADMDQIEYLVVGAGLNVNHTKEDFPPDLQETATSLHIETGQTYSRKDLMQAMLEDLEEWYTVWLEQGFPAVLGKWRELSVSINCPVRVLTLKDTWDGWSKDVDESGALLVEKADGTVHRLISGEVSLRI
jgi:BirA family biotin operon repressor/biotin-[acetyl-CoA-carboxylase] ligase